MSFCFVVSLLMRIFAASYNPIKRNNMKKTLLLTMAVAAMCAAPIHAQNKVKYLSTNTKNVDVTLLENGDQPVQLSRYLFAGYNTLCLPMTLDAAQLSRTARDVKVERLVAIQQEGTTLFLCFADCTSEGIEAGVPYLVYSPTSQTLRARTTEAQQVSTTLKTIRLSDRQGNQVAFGSSWQLRSKDGLYGIPAKQNVTPLESVLVRTTGDLSFLPTRCGFCWELQSSTAQDIQIRHLTDAEATAIQSLTIASDRDGSREQYDLQGRRVTTSGTKGIVIQNGKKVTK